MKIKTVLMPIKVPDTDYCWDGVTVALVAANQGVTGA